jgi:hypothetical protein
MCNLLLLLCLLVNFSFELLLLAVQYRFWQLPTTALQLKYIV